MRIYSVLLRFVDWFEAKGDNETKWDDDAYLGVEFVENVLEVVTLDRLLRVEEIEEFLDELGRDVDFEGTHFDRLVDNELKEELVDSLEVGPGGVHLLLLVDTGLGEVQIALLNVGQGSENIFLNHLHHFVEVGDDDTHHVFLVLEHLLDVCDGIKALSL